MLTEKEKEDLHIFIHELEDRNLAGDWMTLCKLAETTGDEWEKLVRECLAQWGWLWSSTKREEEGSHETHMVGRCSGWRSSL